MKPEMRRKLAQLPFEEKIRKVGELIRLRQKIKTDVSICPQWSEGDERHGRQRRKGSGRAQRELPRYNSEFRNPQSIQLPPKNSNK